MSRSLNRRGAVTFILAAVGAFATAAPAQAQSLPETIEAIDRARVSTRILYVTAHPDDESGSVLTYLARGLHADVALLSITRGEGGQNALGPEQAPQLGVLRTQELLAATRAYGVRLYFTRAPDFGFSKTPEQALKVWGETPLDDMVRVIRTFRPHVVINNWGGVHGGHGHHQAAGLLTPKAVEAAGDPQAFPRQLAEGLAPWKPGLLLQLARGEDGDAYRLPLDDISPLWGKTYRDIGLEGFANHRTQGIAAFLNSPFLRRQIALMTPDGKKFDPARLAEPLAALGSNAQNAEAADRALRQARAAALGLDWREVARDLALAGKLTAEWQAQVAPQKGGQAAETAWELEQERKKVDEALALAAAVRLKADADRSEVVAGQSFTVRVGFERRAEASGEFSKPLLVVPPGWKATAEEVQPGSTRFTVTIPKGATAPGAQDASILPEPPPLVQVRVHANVDGYEFDCLAPVTAQRATSTRVDTLPLTLVPAVTIALEPQQFVVIEKKPPKQLEVLARVHSYATTAAKVMVSLEVPEGWGVSRAQDLDFSGAGDQLARFVVTLPQKVAAGHYALKAVARRDDEVFRASLEPLPSLPTRLWSEPAVAMVHTFDVTVPQDLRVGYIAAENDPIPDALRLLGIHVDLLDPVALAFGDLGRYDAIAIGIRAYELRSDLERSNQRLLDYAAAGGTLVVQYQRNSVWDQLKPAPYPATIVQSLPSPREQRATPTAGDGRAQEPTPSAAPPGVVRVTDKNSPVRFLLPGDSLLNFPNKITADDFRGWVQERGLYFWKHFDPRYRAVLGTNDPGEPEATGGLVYARCGKGVYIYTGLSFFRQLPEGVPGAYRLFVNLLSQSKNEARK